MAKRPHRIKPNRAAFRRLRAAIFERDEWRCKHCGFQFHPEEGELTGQSAPYDVSKNAFLEVDHIHPYSLGGSWEPSNLQALCTQCNRQKWVYIGDVS